MNACLSNLLQIDPADLHGLSISASASLTLLGGYYFIQPVSEEMSLRAGIAVTPYLTVAGLALLTVCNPLYAVLTSMLPLRDVQPVLHRSLSLCLTLFCAAFAMYHSSPGVLPLSFSFSVFLSVCAPFLMSTFWVRMAHLHTQLQAQRVYGVISAGAQVGQLIASIAAAPLFAVFGESVLLVTAVLVECSVRLINRRAKLQAEPPPTSARAVVTAVAREAPCAAASSVLPLLMSTKLLRSVTAHTLLQSFLVNSVWYEKADAASAAFASSEQRIGFFSALNAAVGGVTLLVQVSDSNSGTLASL